MSLSANVLSLHAVTLSRLSQLVPQGLTASGVADLVYLGVSESQYLGYRDSCVEGEFLMTWQVEGVSAVTVNAGKDRILTISPTNSAMLLKKSHVSPPRNHRQPFLI